MSDWSSKFDELAACSQALHGNNYVLPVAVVIAERRLQTVRTSDIAVALQGRLPPNRVLEALVWLARMSVLSELPYPGKPNPRVFEVADSVYWDFVSKFASERAWVRKGPRARPSRKG